MPTPPVLCWVNTDAHQSIDMRNSDEGCSRATFQVVKGELQPRGFATGEQPLGSSHSATFRRLDFLIASLTFSDSSHSSRTGWMKCQMASPCLFFMFLLCHIMSHDHFASHWSILFAFHSSGFHLTLYAVTSHVPGLWSPPPFLSTLVASMLGLGNGTAAAKNASAKMWSHHVLLHWHFTSADTYPPPLKNKVVWETHTNSAVTFCLLLKYPVISNNNCSELNSSSCNFLRHFVFKKFIWKGCSG